MNEQELYEKNTGLVGMTVNRFQDCGIEYDDLFQIGSIGLLKAIRTYDKDKSKFATYAVRVITNEILGVLRKKRPVTISLETPISEDGATIGDTLFYEQSFAPINFNKLTPFERKLLQLQIGGYTQSKYANVKNWKLISRNCTRSLP